MFALQARTMGYHVVVLDPDIQSPAGAVADRQIRAAYDDERRLGRAGQELCGDHHRVRECSCQDAGNLSASHPWFVLRCRQSRLAQDRISEKSFLRSHGFATAGFEPVRQRPELKPALARVRLPALLKISRLGYDGKGQALVKTEPDAIQAFERFGSVACVLEERLDARLRAFGDR